MWIYVPSAFVPESERSTSLFGWPEPRADQLRAFARSVTWRETHMQPGYWQRAWQTAGWMTRLSGLTCAPSTQRLGVARWISSLRASRASRTATPARSAGSTTRGISSCSLPESFARWSRVTSTWRTCRPSEEPDCQIYLGDWPMAGSMRSGVVCRRRRLAPLTGETGSGSWLPTPTANDYGRNAGGQNPGPERLSLSTMARRGMVPTPTTSQAVGTRSGNHSDLRNCVPTGGLLSPSFSERLMGLPDEWTGSGPSGEQWSRWWQLMRFALSQNG